MSEEPISKDDQDFAGIVVLTAALGDLADEVRRLNHRLDHVIASMAGGERETYRWRIGRKP